MNFFTTIYVALTNIDAENNILNDTLIVLASIVQREAANEKEMH